MTATGRHSALGVPAGMVNPAGLAARRSGRDLLGVRPRQLLEPGTDGRDALRVEAEPVHPARVAGVLNLEATVHDHRYATVLGDPRPLLVDHAELAPES